MPDGEAPRRRSLDLPPGAIVAQVAHGIAEFSCEHRSTFEDWHHGSNTLVVKHALDESALLHLMLKLKMRRIRYSAFREPDLKNTVTVVVIEPEGRALAQSFPLAFASE